MSRCTVVALFALAIGVSSGCKEGSPADPGGNGGDGTIAVAVAPASLNVVAGQGGTATVTVSRGGGYDGAVALSLEGTPPGVTGTFSPASISASSTSSTLTLSATSTTAPGSHNLTIRGSGQGVQASTAALAVTVAAPSGITLSVDPANLSIQQGANGTAAIQIARSNFTGPVALSVSSAPAGVTASVSPASVTANSATLTVNVGVSATPGTYTLTVTGQTQGLGIATATLQLTVTMATPGTGTRWMLVSTGSAHTCGITDAGAAYCWGSGDNGILGNGSAAGIEPRPVAVAGGRTWTSVSAGFTHTCGVTAAEETWCWGRGLLGNGAIAIISPETTPVLVSGSQRWASVSAGYNHTCGLTTGGEAYCWGGGDRGALGNGSTQAVLIPVLPSGGHTWKSISAGHGHTCGVTTAGEAYCWGRNDFAQLGNGDRNDRLTPTLVSGGHTWESLTVSSAFSLYTCGVTTAREAYCWGHDAGGQLGIGATADTTRMTPALVGGGQSWSSVGAGGGLVAGYTCGVTSGGPAYCWGSDLFGLGSSFLSSLVPALVPGGHDWQSVEAGAGYGCGVTTMGAAYCWGANGSGQLGTGDTAERLTPTPVSDPP